MKFSAAIALIVFVGLVANSAALPAKKRMVYLSQQQPQWYGAPQRLMYVQTAASPSYTHARSTQAASALVAGESVATGTYLNDCDHAEPDIAVAGLADDAAQQQGGDAFGAAGGAVESVAEADAQVAADVAVDGGATVEGAAVEGAAVKGAAFEGVAVEGAVVEGAAVEGAAFEGNSVDGAAVEGAAVEGVAVELEVENTDAKVPRDLTYDAEVEVPAEEPLTAPAVPTVDIAAELPAPAPITPARRYLPANKKVYVELEQSAEGDEAEVHDDEEDDDEVFVAPVNPVRVPNARRPTKKAAQNAGAAKPSAKPSRPLPSGSFFPIDFGGTSGGAIAIANSFSTGEGGSATSHAIAYGSPDSARFRSKKH